MKAKHILVVGAGSVGKRHMKNFVSLGSTVSAVDPRYDRLEEASKDIPLKHSFETIESALEDSREFDGVAICSPTAFHVSQSEAALKAGLPVLLEKPVAPTLVEAQRLQETLKRNKGKLLLGYTYRWWPPFVEFRKRLQSGEIGTIRYVEFMMGAHLADWHPWERYQEFFMSSKELGGGALLDESHFLDLLVWLFGMPKSLFARVEKISNLEIETDDNVDILVDYANGMRVSLHLDLYRRPHERYIRAVGDGGSIEWSVEPNRVRVAIDAEQKWDEKAFPQERNYMFLAVAKEFLAIIDGSTEPSCTIDDGVKVMQLVEISRKSSKKRKSFNV
ncbi:MAG: Gfo/Idh/MocA family oxidoreductase [Candidatus Pacebacteria bacterium]|jgi:predicted dehydrogenase|nr:dehydrogenase [bacterium]MDP6527899.1 Gfo/Idh/MocA family oxidoreductase [Candidatus Paceibacterota bacterium]MDP6659709.1 Gfo/Idh/MocA family oxidoreductase [Candidatus Paceibacterota bacterium]|tara:strand:- start:17270 stop:18268 length:999 start_codon:yes stop_codon:yes gene_type:complete